MRFSKGRVVTVFVVLFMLVFVSFAVAEETDGKAQIEAQILDSNYKVEWMQPILSLEDYTISGDSSGGPSTPGLVGAFLCIFCQK